MLRTTKLILPVIVISQFCCTSLWFAGNAIMTELISNFNLESTALGHLTAAVQFGFILGTLCFAVFTISDRVSPSKVFLTCAIFGAISNMAVIGVQEGLQSILLLRFSTGFFLAGIYPVGMKIAADYFEKGLGRSLSFLVGALVLGTAFPHLAKDITSAFHWKSVLVLTSSLAVIGGSLMVIMVPDGPYRVPAKTLDRSAFFKVFRDTNFKSAAFGYFGHMWELYAFWAFIPIILKSFALSHSAITFNIPLLSFLIISIGSIGCLLGSYLAEVIGTKKTATIALLLSCCCCLISPWLLNSSQSIIFVGFLLFWGLVVIMDSPLFSTLIAKHAPDEAKGTALTIVNCIGFTITIISIQLLNMVQNYIDPKYSYFFLAFGPIIGLIALLKKAKT